MRSDNNYATSTKSAETIGNFDVFEISEVERIPGNRNIWYTVLTMLFCLEKQQLDFNQHKYVEVGKHTC